MCSVHYNVQCVLYIKMYKLQYTDTLHYNVNCALCHYNLYSIHCNVQCTSLPMYSIQCRYLSVGRYLACKCALLIVDKHCAV